MLEKHSILALALAHNNDQVAVLKNTAEIGREYFEIGDLTSSHVFIYRDIPVGAVLLTHRSFDPASRMIANFQAQKFDNEFHSMWSHVAIMGLDYKVWDITPDENVRSRSIKEFLTGVEYLAVRVLKDFDVDPEKVQEHIEDQRQSSYPALSDLAVSRSLLRGRSAKNMPELELAPNQLICSTFVDRILRMAVHGEIMPEGGKSLILPGDFATSSAFRDLNLPERLFRLH